MPDWSNRLKAMARERLLENLDREKRAMVFAQLDATARLLQGSMAA